MKPLDPFNLDLDRTTLIEASAGTGKTYTITTLYCRLIAQGIAVESILVVTFTEAAAAELKLRIRQRISATLDKLLQLEAEAEDDLVRFFRHSADKALVCRRLSLALTCFDQASILTIHAFCLSMLKENAFECQYPFDVQLMPDRSVFLTQIAHDFFMAHVCSQDPVFLRFLDSRSITPDHFIQAFGASVSRRGIVRVPMVKAFSAVSDAYQTIVQRIQRTLETQADTIADLLIKDSGIDGRSYSRRYVPGWLSASLDKIHTQKDACFFTMTETGDALYKFTRTRLKEKTKPGHDTPSHPFFDDCQELLELSQTFEDNLIWLKHAFFAFFNQALDAIKSHQGICFFDDLINDLSQALAADQSEQLHNAVRQKYAACLIDEFQDTDPAQYDIFYRLFSRPGTPFFMIGDPKQAIYAFRGGDIFAYLRAAADSTQQFTLKHNYRSDPLLVQGINQVFSHVANPFLFDAISFYPVDTPEGAVNRIRQEGQPIAPLQFVHLSAQHMAPHSDRLIPRKIARDRIPEMVAQSVLSTLNTRMTLQHRDGTWEPVTPGDMAVLVRTNQQAQEVHQALSACGIKSYLSRSTSVYDSAQAIDLHDILWAVYHPENRGYVKAALCTGVFHFTAQKIRELDMDESCMMDWQDRFKDYKTLWETRGFVAMIMSLFHSQEGFLTSDPDLDERKLTNYYHLVELISQADIQKKLSPYYLINWYTRQLTRTLRDDAADELRLESDKKAVAIVTIHKSKGLEYPIVFLPYLWEGTRRQNTSNVVFHDPENQYRLTLDIGSDTIDQAAAQAQLEDAAEQRRLLYVALTRASAMCQVFWAAIQDADTSALGCLLHPDGCTDETRMVTDLEQLENLCADAITVVHPDMSFDGGSSQNILNPDPGTTGWRPRLRDVFPAWKISSFSAMTKSLPAPARDQGQGIDDDSFSAAAEFSCTLADFPRGAIAGDAVHKLFETIDFTQFIQNPGAEAQVKKIFRPYGFDKTSVVQMACTAVSQILQTSLDNVPEHFRLMDIGMHQRITEMEFIFPVTRLDLALMADLFQQADSRFETSGYTRVLAKTSEHAVKGFLKGFIDLIIQHRGKWYILDYKTNYLGPAWEHYQPDLLFNAMAAHHYFIQYYLYTVALHRYLLLRQPGYAYETHFGGIFYLFVRGMHPENSRPCGIFFDRPPGEVVADLTRKLSG